MFNLQTTFSDLADIFVSFFSDRDFDSQFVVEIFDPMLRSILDSIMQNKTIPVSISLKIQF